MFLEEQEKERSNKTRQAECKLVEMGRHKACRPSSGDLAMQIVISSMPIQNQSTSLTTASYPWSADGS